MTSHNDSDIIKVLLVDDELTVRSALREILQHRFLNVKVVGEASNIPEAVREIHQHQPDLLFLDIEMPGYTGLQILEFFNPSEITFDIVFVTAFNEYAIQAFKISAFDYLLKPVNEQEISDMLKRYHLRKAQQQVASRMNLLKETLTSKTSPEKLAIASTNGINFVNINNIVLLEASGSYTNIVLKEGLTLMASKSLGEFESLFETNTSFFKAHRSFIINFKYVKSLTTKDGDQIEMINGVMVPLSRYRKKEFEEYIRSMKI
jgi:two-component system, LytTR family, response regulator